MIIKATKDNDVHYIQRAMSNNFPHADTAALQCINAKHVQQIVYNSYSQ